MKGYRHRARAFDGALMRVEGDLLSRRLPRERQWQCWNFSLWMKCKWWKCVENVLDIPPSLGIVSSLGEALRRIGRGRRRLSWSPQNGSTWHGLICTDFTNKIFRFFNVQYPSKRKKIGCVIPGPVSSSGCSLSSRNLLVRSASRTYPFQTVARRRDGKQWKCDGMQTEIQKARRQLFLRREAELSMYYNVNTSLQLVYYPFKKVQSLAKEWTLGCANLAQHPEGVKRQD